MIPLNKPGYLRTVSDDDYIGRHFPDCHSEILSTAGDGLTLVYRSLLEKRGSLRIGVSPLACFQAIYPIVQNGHTPVFVDINPDTLNMDTDKLLQTKRLDAVEVIHLGGNPNEMDKICQWARQNNLIVIEDCAQALGSYFQGRELGSFGDYAVFSLIKNLHAFIGGLLLSKQPLEIGTLPHPSKMLVAYKRLKKYLESMSNHHSYNLWNVAYLSLMKTKENSAQIQPGTKARRVEAALEADLRRGISAVETLNQRRAKLATYMIEHIDAAKHKVQKVPEGGLSNRNRLLFRLPDPVAKQTIARLRRAGIAANNLTQNYLHGFQPHVSEDVLLGSYYHKDGLENYDAVFNHVIAIPCSPFLTQEETDYIITTLNQIS